jgi:sugar (pentulose or hexulose) kinase
MGERGPRPAPAACGALVGLTLRHGRPHVTRAVLEGTAFQIRRIIEAHRRAGRGGPVPAAGVTGGIACGGAARSDVWMQILADVTGLTPRVPAAAECAALGAAMLGGAAAGAFTLAEAVARMTRYRRDYEPELGAAARYDGIYGRYCELDDLLLPWYDGERKEPAS